ncbi:unnamed protein product [Peronospora belbahrii]|uniref:Uncharacterized protein n=1 Tax=Peronospora belbahrii TaxID=622444 RepID=A0AAU9LAQ2_9STRA|nr:unnamed protein product [Peronospora belbahrii]
MLVLTAQEILLTIAEPAPAATGATDETVKHTTDTLIDASATPEPTIPTSNETEGFENSGDVTVLPNNPTDEATTKSSTTAQTEPPVKDSSHSSIPPTGKRPCPPLPQPKTPCPPLPQPKTPCPPLPQPKTPCPPLPQPKTPCPPLPRPKETAGSIDESMQEQQGSDKTKVKASTAAGGIVFGHALIVVSTIITYLLL